MSENSEMAEILFEKYASVLRKPIHVINDEFIESLIEQKISGPEVENIKINRKVLDEAIDELRKVLHQVQMACQPSVLRMEVIL